MFYSNKANFVPILSIISESKIGRFACFYISSIILLHTVDPLNKAYFGDDNNSLELSFAESKLISSQRFSMYIYVTVY